MNATHLFVIGLFVAAAAHAQDVPRFTISANGQEVVYAAKGLVWARCAEGMSSGDSGCTGSARIFNHEAAQAHARQLVKASGLKWRLPHPDELQSLTSPFPSSRHIDPRVFPDTPGSYFWTSERIDDQFAYTIHFHNGIRYSRYQTSLHHLRLVREQH